MSSEQSDEGNKNRRKSCSMDALSVLMQASRRQSKRKRSSSQFVLCPAGCGKSIVDSLINVHLDQCLVSTGAVVKTDQTQQTPDGEPDPEPDPSASETEPASHPGNAVTQDETHMSPPHPCSQLEQASQNNSQSPVASSHLIDASSPVNVEELPVNIPPVSLKTPKLLHGRNSGTTEPPNAFSRMMEKSKVVFASGKGPIQQCLYLASDGCVSLHDGTRPNRTDNYPIAWSAVVVLKDRASTSNGEGSTSTMERRPLEVTIATAMPNQESPSCRLVKNHSRLSIPVLKSILQKSVRRRKPLPAVRVAMELADKSLGDLLRRLPVIVLEDSTLHPDFPLLIWLMMAHSKGFCLSKTLMTRVMQIVFEVATCQWSDDPSLLQSSTCSSDTEHLCLGTLLASELDSTTAGWSRTMLFSILVRAEYGGMKCDVEMLLQYADLWQARFRVTGVPSTVASRLGFHDGELPSWPAVPTRIHERARAQSVERVPLLCANGIERLVLEDICVEGVDFHCSSIMDHFLSLPVAGVCTDILILSKDEEVPTTAEGRRSFIAGIFKHCMWHYSSGVNRRQPLVAHHKSLEQDGPSYEELWKELMAKEVQKFQASFVRERLV